MLKKYANPIVMLALIALFIALFSLDPIAQDQSYHDFADGRMMWGVPNGINVLTNIPMVIVAIICLWLTFSRRSDVPKDIYISVAVFFLGLFLTAFGSGYYHWSPDDASLVWDRLPMTILFGSLTYLLMAAFCLKDRDVLMLVLFVAVAMGSLLYHYFTKMVGLEDLRLYLFVQLAPLLLVPLTVLLYAGNAKRKAYLVALFVLYCLAKACELYDELIFGFLGFAGHGLKHLCAAAASILVYFAFIRITDYPTPPELVDRSRWKPVKGCRLY